MRALPSSTRPPTVDCEHMAARARSFALSLLTFSFVAGCKPPPSSPSAPSSSLSDAPILIEWLLDEQVRGRKTTNKGTNLGVLTRDLKGEAKDTWTLRPNSCKSNLAAFLPFDEQAEVLLGIDKEGLLYRYEGDGWSPVPSVVSIPKIGRLLGVARFFAYDEVLVTLEVDNRQELALLSFSQGQVVYRHLPDAARLGADRDDALHRFRSARCTDVVRNCLHLTEIDDAVALMLEPELYDNRVELDMLEKGQIKDVRYANPEGTRIDVLTTEGCNDADEPEPAPADDGPHGAAAPEVDGQLEAEKAVPSAKPETHP